MPVLVTGAESGVGKAAVRALLGTAGEVRVWLDDVVADEDLVQAYRRVGVKTARGELDDEGRLELACEQVHTVVHLHGGPLTAPGTELDDLASVLSAAIGAGCRRLVWASHVGADDPRGNSYLEACAEAEALLADAPLETVVIRRALTYGPDDPLTATLAAGGADGARLDARHAPLFVDDLVAAVVSADRMERGSGRHVGHLTVTLAGPDEVRLGDLVDVLQGPSRRSRRRPVQPDAPLPAHTVDLLSRDLLPVAGALGRTGTPLAVGAARLAGADER